MAADLTVTLQPEGAVTAGAQWRVDAGEWQNSGVTVEDLGAGDHAVEFHDATGYTTPTSFIQTIESTAIEKTVTYTEGLTVKEMDDSYEIQETNEDVTIVRRFVATGESNPARALQDCVGATLTNPGALEGFPARGDPTVVYGDINVVATDFRARRVPNTKDKVSIEVYYRQRALEGRRTVGASVDRFETEFVDDYMAFSLDATPIPLGPDNEGLTVRRRMRVWHRTMWAEYSAEPYVGPLIDTRNDDSVVATIDGAERTFTAGTLRLIDFGEVQLGLYYWERHYKIGIDEESEHAATWVDRDADGAPGSEESGIIYPEADWTYLFIDTVGT